MDKQIKCIYCNAVKNITDSDIIPYALTVAKLHKKFVCEKHNKFTNDNYEDSWINSLAVFRNHLGLTTRRGNNITYNATVTIGDYNIKNAKFTDVSTMLESKESVYQVNGNKNILFGNIDKISQIAESRGGKITEVELSSFNISTQLSSASFTSRSVLHAIAKIAYESHCYFNDINEYNSGIYSEIVDYILDPNNDNLIVEIVTDNGIYNAFDDSIMCGTNVIFEYDDIDRYRYVIFGLWNVIFYKIKLCPTKILTKSNRQCMVNLFYTDGNVKTLEIKNVKHILSEKADEAMRKIFPEFSKRLMGLYRPYFSYKNLLRKKKMFEEHLLELRNGTMSINEFLEIGNFATISYVYIFEFLLQNKERYRQEDTFQNNLNFLIGSDIFKVSEDTLNNWVQRYRALHENGEFIKILEQAFNFFDTLTE